jgi:hypothetical protein
MRSRILVATVAAFAVMLGADLFACGDKFLSSGRGTRYQRPKDARAASVLIYTTPASGSAAVLEPTKLESVLKHGGHRATTVASVDQLSAILQGGRFDVVLVAPEATAVVQQLLGNAPDAAVLLSVTPPPKTGTLLRAIDKAVEQRDRNIKKMQHSRT